MIEIPHLTKKFGKPKSGSERTEAFLEYLGEDLGATVILFRGRTPSFNDGDPCLLSKEWSIVGLFDSQYEEESYHALRNGNPIFSLLEELGATPPNKADHNEAGDYLKSQLEAVGLRATIPQDEIIKESLESFPLTVCMNNLMEDICKYVGEEANYVGYIVFPRDSPNEEALVNHKSFVPEFGVLIDFDECESEY